jgi:cytochrome c553
MLRYFSLSIQIGCVLLLSSSLYVRAQDTQQADALTFFETQVRPILAEHCYECHSAKSKKLQAGLRLDHIDLIRTGGDSGPAIVDRDRDSALLQAVRYESYEMPPTGKLSDEQIGVLEKWVALGSPWPKESVPEMGAAENKAFDLQQRKSEQWVWQPRIHAPLPLTKNTDWSRNSIDAFILEKLEQRQLQPNVEADRGTLVRRLYLDLIGLPPSLAELQTIIDDESEDWYERLVDRLLASPELGVRWGRHWLDLARYAESRGHEFDEDILAAFQYRDYVVRAFNQDVPYDQFVTEQIAGDLLKEPRLNRLNGWNESIIGTGFWHLGEMVHSPVDTRKDETDRFDNMIDVFAKSFLGLTVTCARCHDHKFDAISTADYYSLYGFLQSCDFRQVRFQTWSSERQSARELDALRSHHESIARRNVAEFLKQLQTSLPNQSKAIDALQEIASRPIAAPLPVDSALVRVDYRSDSLGQWFTDGVAFGMRPQQSGQMSLDCSSRRVAVAPFAVAEFDSAWAKLSSDHGPKINSMSSIPETATAGRALITPTFEVTSGVLSYLLRGNCQVFAVVDSHRLVAGPLHGSTLATFKGEDTTTFRWVTQDLQRYRGKRIHLEIWPIENSPLMVAQVIDGAAPPAVKSPVSSVASPSTTELELKLAAVRDILTDAASLLGGQSVPEIHRSMRAAAAIEWCVANRSSVTSEDKIAIQAVEQGLSEWCNDQSKLIEKLPIQSMTCPGMTDGSGENDFVLVRGNHENLGEPAPRRFLAAFGGEPLPSEIVGSGRLWLAEQVTHPDNPQSARVIANRVWHHLIGRGIVPTVDDFGVLGERPTHLELLDHLANKLVEHDWSVKDLMRSIVLSQSYRQSSSRDLDDEADAQNIWLHRAHVKRMPGETIRDNMLAIAGRIDLQQGGPSVPAYLTDFMQGRGRPGGSGPMDGNGRRSIYLAVRRNFLSPFMLTFDTPAPFSSMGRRNQSNVPAQSLIMLNDELVREMANRWSEQIVKAPGSDANRVETMYRTAFGRTPTEQELNAALKFIRSSIDQQGSTDQVAWMELAHVLFTVKEFVFYF